MYIWFFERRILYIEKYAMRCVFHRHVPRNASYHKCVMYKYTVYNNMLWSYFRLESQPWRLGGRGKKMSVWKLSRPPTHTGLGILLDLERCGDATAAAASAALRRIYIYILFPYTMTCFILYFSLLRVNTLGEHKGCAPKVSNSRMYESGN